MGQPQLADGHMRAVCVDELGSIANGRMQRVPIPQVGPDEVLLEVRAVSVKYVDLITLQGRYQFRPPLPYTPGKGPAGVIRSVGQNVEDIQIGDRVLGMAEHGGFAEMAKMPRDQVHPLPDALRFGEAAAMAVAFDTAWVALRDRARLQAGDSVLVLGATGAVGNAAVQLARAMGASKVLAGLKAPERLEVGFLAELVDGAVDLGRPNLRDAVREQVMDLTSGRGVDTVIDAVGGDAFDGAIRSVAWRGRYVVVGFASGRIASLATNYVLLKNIEVTGLQISDYRKRMPQLVAKAFRDIFEFVHAGRVRAPDYRVMPLDDWAGALHSMEQRQTNGLLVLEPMSGEAP